MSAQCSPYSIMPAAAGHLPALDAIERAAATLFSPQDIPPHLQSHTVGMAALLTARQSGLLWVALHGGQTPVGFALVQHHGDYFHLHELDVHPAHGRRGVGSALLEAVLEGAQQRNAIGVTLSTFRHVPWNMPFYERFGFKEIVTGDGPPYLQAFQSEEAEMGLNMANRVCMLRTLG